MKNIYVHEKRKNLRSEGEGDGKMKEKSFYFFINSFFRFCVSVFPVPLVNTQRDEYEKDFFYSCLRKYSTVTSLRIHSSSPSIDVDDVILKITNSKMIDVSSRTHIFASFFSRIIIMMIRRMKLMMRMVVLIPKTTSKFCY
jgi:hypothetical protein